MIELTYSDISQERFVEAFNTLLEKDVDVGDAVEIARSLELVQKELNNFKKVRDELIKRYGVEVKDEKGTVNGWTMVGAEEAKMKEFEPKFNELLEQKFPLSLETKVGLDKKDGKMKPIHAFVLRKIVDFKK
jgi:hypothetical protein